MKAAGYYKILASRAEGRISSRRVEGVINSLQVYHLDPRDNGVDIDVCIPKLVLRAREPVEIRPMDKKRGPKKTRAVYAPTKDDVKDDNNNDDDDNEAMDNAYPDYKAPSRKVWDLMWDNGGPGVWAPDYREQYDLKDAEWRFDAVTKIMDVINVSDYVDPDIEPKWRELE